MRTGFSVRDGSVFIAIKATQRCMKPKNWIPEYKISQFFCITSAVWGSKSIPTRDSCWLRGLQYFLALFDLPKIIRQLWMAQILTVRHVIKCFYHFTVTVFNNISLWEKVFWMMFLWHSLATFSDWLQSLMHFLGHRFPRVELVS